MFHGADDEAVAGPGERHHDEDEANLHEWQARVLPEQADRNEDQNTAPEAGAVQGEQAGSDEGAEVGLFAEQLKGTRSDNRAKEENAADPECKGERADGAEQRLHGDSLGWRTDAVSGSGR